MFTDNAFYHTGNSVYQLTLLPIPSHWHFCVIIDITAHPTSCHPYIHRTKISGSRDYFEWSEGNMLPNGTWTSILGFLQRRELDATYYLVTMSSSRLDVVDFTIGAIEMRYCHVYR